MLKNIDQLQLKHYADHSNKHHPSTKNIWGREMLITYRHTGKEHQ